MMKIRNADKRAQAITLDANTVKIGLIPAINALSDALAGWPTNTPGAAPATIVATVCGHPDCVRARPCPDHDGGLAVDSARKQLEQLDRDLALAQTVLARLAGLVTKWAWGNLNDTQIAARLTAIDAGIWCKHCTQFGRHEPREAGHTECSFCRRFRSDYKQLPPKEIWDARDARNGRIDQTTILRILKQLKARRKQDKRSA